MKEIVKKIGAIVGVAVVVGSLIWANIAQTTANNNAEALQVAQSALISAQQTNAELNANIDTLNSQLAQYGVSIDRLENIIESNKQIIEDYEAELAAMEEEDSSTAGTVEETGYDLDEFGLAETISEIITDHDYDKLLDADVEFDGDDYGFEEVLSFIATSDINGEDYGADTYLVIEEGDLEYKVVFDNDLNTSLIDEDETLTINFLGKELEITEWESDKITIDVGQEFLLTVGENATYNDKLVELKVTGDDYAYVGVDGVFDKIDEDRSEKINGLNIKVDFVVENGFANLKIWDEDIDTTIESGDEFAEDSAWEYEITPNAIKLVLAEDLTDIDEDSDFKALAQGESIALPNEYLFLTYNGISDEDFVGVDFSEKNGFVKAKGEFNYGFDDYDLIYINSTGFYDEDYNFISSGNIEIDDTDSVMNLSSAKDAIVVNDVVLKLDFSDATVNGNSVLNKEDDYRSSYGIVVESPEDNLDDEEFSISVPEEKLEVTITVN